MVQKVQVLLLDDIDGSSADDTVNFELDGVIYEIDLTDEHANELRAALARYIEHGRRISGRSGRPAAPSRRRQPPSENTQEVRAWAREKGYEVKDQGRIPANIMVQFREAHS